MGDYPDHICSECRDLLGALPDVAAEIQNEADAKIEQIKEQWRTKCRENASKNVTIPGLAESEATKPE